MGLFDKAKDEEVEIEVEAEAVVEPEPEVVEEAPLVLEEEHKVNTPLDDLKNLRKKRK